MHEGKPLISVIIPTYNRARLLKRAIESVVKKIDSRRMRYHRNPTNLGSQASRNIGIRIARGEYVNFLDSDDELLPRKLELQHEAFSKVSERVGVVYSYCHVVNEVSGQESEWQYKTPWQRLPRAVEGTEHRLHNPFSQTKENNSGNLGFL